MVSSTLGWPTTIGWKRRSRAASFSMCLLVFIERGGADGAQFAAGQGRLEQVAGVHRALGLAGADDGVQFVDEEDDLPVAAGDFLDDGLEAVLEFAAVFGAGDQRAHVQGDDALVLQHGGHVAVEHADGQAFDDGRLADARLADQHGIVLGPAGQHLHGAADFLVAADDRIDLPLPGHLDQIAAVSLQGLVFVFGVLVGDALAAADFLEGREDGVVVDAADGKDFLRLALHLRQGQQQMLGGDVFVLEPVGFLLGLVEDIVEDRLGPVWVPVALGRRSNSSETIS